MVQQVLLVYTKVSFLYFARSNLMGGFYCTDTDDSKLLWFSVQLNLLLQTTLTEI